MPGWKGYKPTAEVQNRFGDWTIFALKPLKTHMTPDDRSDKNKHGSIQVTFTRAIDTAKCILSRIRIGTYFAIDREFT